MGRACLASLLRSFLAILAGTLLTSGALWAAPAEDDEDAPPAGQDSEDVAVLQEMDREVAEVFKNIAFTPPPGSDSLEGETPTPHSFRAPPFDQRLLRMDPDKDATALQPRPKPLTETAIAGRVFDIPVVRNVQVQSWIDFFSGRGRGYFRRYLERSGAYLPLMQEVFAAQGLPKDLCYVALIESGFANTARSYAGAAGPWQFMPGTGRRHGLTVTRELDQRRDFVLATRAAADHLALLFRRYNDWYLSLAAYNAGAGRIDKAIARHQTRDYWLMSQYPNLALETKLYVAKFVAAVIMAHDPASYGFHNLEFMPPLTWDTVQVAGPATLEAVARAADAPSDVVEALNPMFLKGRLPPGDPWELRLPAGSLETFTQRWGSPDVTSRTPPPKPAPVAVNSPPQAEEKPPRKGGSYETVSHTVRFGETLETIAQRYDSSVTSLVADNRLEDPDRIHPGQKLAVKRFVADPSWGVDEQGAPSLMRARATKGGPDPFTGSASGGRVHVLRRGETLGHLAMKYGTTVARLKALNRIRNPSTLQIGQKIIVRP